MMKTQAAVIGGGPGGYAAAFRAADLGLETVLIDTEAVPGGVCLHRGCIPSKALLHAARVLTESQEAEAFGIRFGEPVVDIDKLRTWKDGIVKRLTGGLGQLAKQRKVRYLRGRARFSDSSTLEVVLQEGGSEKVSFEHAVLAAGSVPAGIPFLPVGTDRVWDSTGALELKRVPKSLLVVGGGYIGLEMGTVYASLGTSVSVVEMLDGLLPGADRDLVNVLARRAGRIFKDIHLETKVAAIDEQDGGLRVRFEGRHQAEESFDAVLVAVGRKPNSSGLGLENTKVRLGPKGFVRTDAQRRTEDPSIFAIGDVAGEPMLAHKASHEGRLAAEVIAGSKDAFEPQAVPAVVFTDPELAWCGLTQPAAEAEGRKVEVARFPWAASGRALTLGRTDGMTKLVLEPGTGRILGVGIVGPGAGELIAEGVLAVEMGAAAEDLSVCIHPHPTLSESLMEAAEVFLGSSTHIYRPKKRAASQAPSKEL